MINGYAESANECEEQPNDFVTVCTGSLTAHAELAV